MSTNTVQQAAIVGSERTRRLRRLADAHRRVEIARDAMTLDEALADREAIERPLWPLSEKDCAVVDQRLHELREAARRHAEEAVA